MSKFLRARPIRVGDGEFIATLMEKITPLHAHVIPTLRQRLERLILEEAAIGVIVESVHRASKATTVVGTTLLGFIRDSFADVHFRSPQPALTSNLLASIGPKSLGYFLTREEQAKANLGNGMHQAIIEFAVEPMDMQDPDFAVVMNELYSAYFKFERGYNIKSVFVEADARLEKLILGSGLLHVCYMDLPRDNASIVVPDSIGTKRGFYRSSRSDIVNLPPSSAAPILMTYIKPTFRFTFKEQRLLSIASDGLTDSEIAEELKISHDAVKQAWRGIYDHVLDVMPEIVSDGGLEPATGRGLEKRRRIVAYINNNPQELRPHYLRRGTS